jgi:hypothetical protein
MHNQWRKGAKAHKERSDTFNTKVKQAISIFFCAITPLHLRAIAPLCLIPEFKTVI